MFLQRALADCASTAPRPGIAGEPSRAGPHYGTRPAVGDDDWIGTSSRVAALCGIGFRETPLGVIAPASKTCGRGYLFARIAANHVRKSREQLAGHSRGIGGDVVEGERHRHAGVEAHQRDDVGDADVAEGGDGAVEDALRYPARVSEARRHL